MKTVAYELRLVSNSPAGKYRGTLSRLMEVTKTTPRYQLYELGFRNSSERMEVNAVVVPTRSMPSILRIQELFQ